MAKGYWIARVGVHDAEEYKADIVIVEGYDGPQPG